MELFQNVEYVRLQSMAHGTYIHASEDGRSTHLSTDGTSYNGAWAVEQCNIHGIDCIRLRGVYGRYLGIPDSKKLWPMVSAVQRDFDRPGTNNITWQVNNKRDNIFELKSFLGPFLSIGHYFSGRTVRDWKLHSLVPTSIMPLAPPPCANRWCCPLKREINWVLAKRSGAINEDAWGKFSFIGRNISTLKEQLDLETKDFSMSLFLRAGSEGSLTPLYVNLPRSSEPLYVVGLWDAAANDRLVFPNLQVGIIEMTSVNVVQLAA